MFEAVLIIYVLEIAKNDAGNVSVTPFETMAQCEQAIAHTQKVLDSWHYGNDKSDIVPVKKSMVCKPITPGNNNVGLGSSVGGMSAPAEKYKPEPPVDNSGFGKHTW